MLSVLVLSSLLPQPTTNMASAADGDDQCEKSAQKKLLCEEMDGRWEPTCRDRGNASRVAIIGAGFSGMGMAIKLLESGREDFVILERAEDVGGTWQANTYPGCQCDVPSNLYSFSFAPNPNWSQTFPLQAEIWEYLRGVADSTASALASGSAAR